MATLGTVKFMLTPLFYLFGLLKSIMTYFHQYNEYIKLHQLRTTFFIGIKFNVITAFISNNILCNVFTIVLITLRENVWPETKSYDNYSFTNNITKNLKIIFLEIT